MDSQTPAPASPWQTIATLVWSALRSIAITVAGFTFVGLILAGISGYILRENAWYAALGVAIALVEAIGTGLVLGLKRGVATALVNGLEALHLGRSAVRLLFERILRLSTGDAIGERGARVARMIERVPLAQAERWLNQAVADVVKGDRETTGLTGWIRRTLQFRLCGLLAKLTLARFREAESTQGGIDLARVQSELETTVDQTLIEKLRGGLTLWTILALLALPAAVAIQTWLALMLLHAK